MNKICKKCAYRLKILDKAYCDYIGATGHPRGCPPGERCDKFKPLTRAMLAAKQRPTM